MAPAPASADPTKKVNEITRSVLIPISEAALRFIEAARSAVPIRVFRIRKRRPIISEIATRKMIS